MGRTSPQAHDSLGRKYGAKVVVFSDRFRGWLGWWVGLYVTGWLWATVVGIGGSVSYRDRALSWLCIKYRKQLSCICLCDMNQVEGSKGNFTIHLCK